MRKLVLVAVGAALLALPPAATSRTASNTVEPTAELSKQGRRAEVGVLLACDHMQRVRLRVTLTQTSEAERTGAFAQAKRKVECTTEKQRFPVKATLRRQTLLEGGEATVCVLALMSDDARQWCKDITLE